MQRNVFYTLENLVPVMQSFLDEGKQVVISAVGNSMHPLIRNGRDAIVLTAYKGQPLKVGDMAFFKRNDTQYVLHRIVALEKDGSFTMLGDNQITLEKGIRREQIIALPTEIIRGKKRVALTSKGYQRYVAVWTKHIFLRKVFARLASIKSRLVRMVKG